MDEAICKPGLNAEAVVSLMHIWVLNKFAQEQLAPWVKDAPISDTVLRAMATIPMEWIGHIERKGIP